jgi:hypothetical protein
MVYIENQELATDMLSLGKCRKSDCRENGKRIG